NGGRIDGEWLPLPRTIHDEDDPSPEKGPETDDLPRRGAARLNGDEAQCEDSGDQACGGRRRETWGEGSEARAVLPQRVEEVGIMPFRSKAQARLFYSGAA